MELSWIFGFHTGAGGVAGLGSLARRVCGEGAAGEVSFSCLGSGQGSGTRAQASGGWTESRRPHDLQVAMKSSKTGMKVSKQQALTPRG